MGAVRKVHGHDSHLVMTSLGRASVPLLRNDEDGLLLITREREKRKQ